MLKIPAAVVDYLCGFPKKPAAQPSKDPSEWQVVKRKQPGSAVREVYVMPWHLQEKGVPFSIGKVETRGRKRQLLMEVLAYLDGEERKMNVLIGSTSKLCTPRPIPSGLLSAGPQATGLVHRQRRSAARR